MPGLDPKVAMHLQNIQPKVKPVKQPQRRLSPESMGAIDSEVTNLTDSIFIREEKYPI